MIRTLIALCTALLLWQASCSSITRFQERGYVSTDIFDYETSFTTIKSIILLPVSLDGGEPKTFLFDTGADLTFVQRDQAIGKKNKVGGASGRTMVMGEEVINSLQIGEVEFKETVAWNGNLEGLKDSVENFGGLIGQPVIRKANWLIDYPRQTIRLTNKDLADSSFHTIEIDRKGGSPYIYLTIGSEKYKAIVDLGSSRALSVPRDSELAGKLLATYETVPDERQAYTIGGYQLTKAELGTLPSLTIDGLVIEDVDFNVRETSQLRVGNRLFKDYQVYIDNKRNRYALRRAE